MSKRGLPGYLARIGCVVRSSSLPPFLLLNTSPNLNFSNRQDNPFTKFEANWSYTDTPDPDTGNDVGMPNVFYIDFTGASNAGGGLTDLDMDPAKNECCSQFPGVTSLVFADTG